MTRQQNTVIWIGLILIAFNIIINVSEFKGILFGGSKNTASSGSTSNSNSSSGGVSTVPGIPAPASGGVTIPFGGFPITIPLSSTTATPSNVQVD